MYVYVDIMYILPHINIYTVVCVQYKIVEKSIENQIKNQDYFSQKSSENLLSFGFLDIDFSSKNQESIEDWF